MLSDHMTSYGTVVRENSLYIILVIMPLVLLFMSGTYKQLWSSH